MRGKDKVKSAGVQFVRITPAYAGKSESISVRFSPLGDHPRLCGEKPTS